MCTCSTAKRRRRQARLVKGRKIKDLGFKMAARFRKAKAAR